MQWKWNWALLARAHSSKRCLSFVRQLSMFRQNLLDICLYVCWMSVFTANNKQCVIRSCHWAATNILKLHSFFSAPLHTSTPLFQFPIFLLMMSRPNNSTLRIRFHSFCFSLFCRCCCSNLLFLSFFFTCFVCSKTSESDNIWTAFVVPNRFFRAWIVFYQSVPLLYMYSTQNVLKFFRILFLYLTTTSEISK